MGGNRRATTKKWSKGETKERDERKRERGELKTQIRGRNGSGTVKTNEKILHSDFDTRHVIKVKGA